MVTSDPAAGMNDPATTMKSNVFHPDLKKFQGWNSSAMNFTRHSKVKIARTIRSITARIGSVSNWGKV